MRKAATKETRSGSTREPLTVVALQDRALVSFADGEVDGAGSAWNQGDRCWLVALPDDLQRAVATFRAEAFDVCATRFADSKSVETEQDSECRVWACRGENVETGVLGPLEEVPEVVPVGLKSASAVAGVVLAMRSFEDLVANEDPAWPTIQQAAACRCRTSRPPIG